MLEKMTKRKAICLVAVLMIIGGVFLFHEAQGKHTGKSFTVMTYNVGTHYFQKPNMERVLQLLAETDTPDVLLLQEVPGKAEARNLVDKLSAIDLIFHRYHPSGRGGLAIISRYPIKPIDIFRFGRFTPLAAEVDVGGKRTLLLCVHLERIKGIKVTDADIKLPWTSAFKLLKQEMTQSTPRTKAVDKILAWLETQEYDHIIIGGDFNTVPFSKAIRKMGRVYDDALWPSFDYLTGSYNKLSLPIKPRIDYIFHSPGLRCNTASVIKESPGDHYPVRAVFHVEG
jgi:endonuclease/exonuclease/phosphatase family metal-dependent hydrolase